MNMSPELRANWLMVKALCFPASWMMWMLVVGVALLLVGDLLIWKFDNPIAMYIGASLTFMYAFILAMFLPSQMVSMASSKQFYWLKHLRQKLAFIMFSCCLLVSLFVSIFLVFGGHKLYFASTLLAVFCVVSIIFSATVVLAKFFSTGQFFIFIFSTLYMKLGQFVHSNIFIGLAILCFSWLLFLFWWFKWKPQRFQKSYFGISQSEFAAANDSQSFHLKFNVCDAKPKTLVGSMLLGYADGLLSQAKRALSPLTVVVVIIALGTLMMGGTTFMNALSMNMNFFLMFILVGFAFSFNISLPHNLRKIWMFYDGPRRNLPKYVESMWFPFFVVNVAVVLIVFLSLVYLHVIQSFTMTNILLMAIFSCLFATIALYASLIIYCMTKASVIWSTWVNGFIYLFFIVSFNSAAKYLDFDSHIIMTFGLGLVALLIAVLLRQWTLIVWRNADILRGVN